MILIWCMDCEKSYGADNTNLSIEPQPDGSYLLTSRCPKCHETSKGVIFKPIPDKLPAYGFENAIDITPGADKAPIPGHEKQDGNNPPYDPTIKKKGGPGRQGPEKKY